MLRCNALLIKLQWTCWTLQCLHELSLASVQPGEISLVPAVMEQQQDASLPAALSQGCHDCWAADQLRA